MTFGARSGVRPGLCCLPDLLTAPPWSSGSAELPPGVRGFTPGILTPEDSASGSKAKADAKLHRHTWAYRQPPPHSDKGATQVKNLLHLTDPWEGAKVPPG